MSTVVEYAAFGQWALLVAVLAACIAFGWLLSFVPKYRHQRKDGRHEPDA